MICGGSDSGHGSGRTGVCAFCANFTFKQFQLWQVSKASVAYWAVKITENVVWLGASGYHVTGDREHVGRQRQDISFYHSHRESHTMSPKRH